MCAREDHTLKLENEPEEHLKMITFGSFGEAVVWME